MPEALPPGSTIGILGAGQLGRMLAMAAARLGLKVHVFAQDPAEPAFQVAATGTIASWTDAVALERFARSVCAVTYEFENVPVDATDLIAAHVPVRPGPLALAKTQDRLIEKTFLRGLTIETAPFAVVNTPDDLRAAVSAIGLPAILKTRRFGYDGKGQVLITEASQQAEALAALAGAPAILEGFVPFRKEVSVVATRSIDGSFAAYDVCENEHKHHILATTHVPARISEATAAAAINVTRRILDALDYIGTIAVEMFVIEREGKEHVIVNEIAPRVHNSGHWTLDGAVISQFEQHVRAIAGWPLGSTRRHGRIEMRNLIGHDADRWSEWAARDNSCLHLYGKSETRPGRKMGHVTTIFPDE